MKQKRSFLADFHVHSTFSDGYIPLKQVIDLYGSRGFGAIAVTDHIAEEQNFVGQAAIYLEKCLNADSFQVYLKALEQERERAWHQYGMVVLTGFELSKNSLNNHKSAHILGIGVSNYISADGDAIDLCKKIHDQGAIAIAAHPVHTRKWEKQTYHLWDRREELAEHFDAWEVASGPYLFDEVAAAKIPKIASGDVHVPRQISSWKSVLHCERHPEAILNAIRKQEIDYYFYRDTH